MSLRCYSGYCHQGSDDLTIGLPSPIADFEAWILHNKFQSTLQQLTSDSSYHAYLTMMQISAAGSLAAVWNEYVHFPAPKFLSQNGHSHRYSQPVQTGETSFVYFGVLVGGLVEHVVRPDIFALANVTLRFHVLYPGYIIRWLQQGGDGSIESFTLGRGIGGFPRINESKGAEMFMNLDKNITESLRK